MFIPKTKAPSSNMMLGRADYTGGGIRTLTSIRSTDFHTTTIFTAFTVCGLDFLFTVPLGLGAPCKASTLARGYSLLARDCHQPCLLRFPRISGVHLYSFLYKAQIVKVRGVYHSTTPAYLFLFCFASVVVC